MPLAKMVIGQHVADVHFGDMVVPVRAHLRRNESSFIESSFIESSFIESSFVAPGTPPATCRAHNTLKRVHHAKRETRNAHDDDLQLPRAR